MSCFPSPCFLRKLSSPPLYRTSPADLTHRKACPSSLRSIPSCSSCSQLSCRQTPICNTLRKSPAMQNTHIQAARWSPGIPLFSDTVHRFRTLRRREYPHKASEPHCHGCPSYPAPRRAQTDGCTYRRSHLSFLRHRVLRHEILSLMLRR